MKALIACEESQVECIALREIGIYAYSCDIKPCSGGHPEWHIQDDVRNHLTGWDLIIAHPPCTDTAVSGARHFPQKRNDGRQLRAIVFFALFVDAPCEKIAIEQPISIISTIYRKPDQIIHPWMFGHGETKAICLWLKGLPCLIPTNIVDGREQRIWRMPPSEKRAELRSKSYPGIAKAMAEQWGQLQ